MHMGQKPSAQNNSCSSERPCNQSTSSGSRTSSDTLQEEEETSWCYTPADETATADQSDWNDCGIPVPPSGPEAQGGDEPTNPFIYLGSRPVAKRKNVLLFGETGVGKSSVINLMAGAEVAETSSSSHGCTLRATEYAFDGVASGQLCIYDTVGLNEPEMGVNTFFGAIEKAHQLIMSLHDAGGIDLLLFCVRGGRVSTTVQHNHRLFFEFLCGKEVRLAFVVTHLENEPGTMENWWKKNEKTLNETYGMPSDAHVCITAAPARVTSLASRRAESRIALHKMLNDVLSNPNKEPYKKDVWSWFSNFVEMLRSFVMKWLPASVQIRALRKRLQKRCKLSEADAQRLAERLVNGR